MSLRKSARLARPQPNRSRAHLDRALLDADAERDKELKAIDDEFHRQREIPTRLGTDSEGEYMARLVRRQLQDSQRVAAATFAAMDVHIIDRLHDPAAIQSIVEECFATSAPEVITRVGRAAEARLATLSRLENKKVVDGIGPRAAFTAHLHVQARLRDWRATTKSQSVESRREAIRARHTLRTAQIRDSVIGAARVFGLEQFVSRAALKAVTGTKPAA